MTFKKAQATEDYVTLNCSYPGCGRRWSVDIGSPKCSFHQWGSAPKPRVDSRPTRVFSSEEKLDILRKAANIGKSDSKAWAFALRDRDEAGDALTPFQRRSYKEVLR